MKNLACLFLVFTSLTTNAGGLVQNAVVTAIENAQNLNQDSFVVTVSGGTGVCADNLIFFPATATGSHQDIYKRAYSSALAALTSGMKVDIHSFSDNTCSNATWIKIKR
ncbi:DUF5992 family protein [Enterovibrio norvegicus]|uniref:DUF5992 family protein n=1 Tax=Enterovibrio norvegicus TaxID=188144 RepID=UPI000C843351|nr:DUF5992 family protein [Enterovibrio norvegicus]PMH72654.1 hypothetical protein BCU62_03270 [Enterovibrio norvegicus]